MKKLLVAFAFLFDGVIIGLIAGLLLSTEQRLKLSRQLAPAMEGIAGKLEQMPDE